MKKNLILAIVTLLLPVHCHRNGNADVRSLTNERGVEINGVVWATRNVDKPGAFAANPEDPGRAYRNEDNDPCPQGWHMPTWVEFQSLHRLRVADDTDNRQLLGLVLGNRRLIFPAWAADSSGSSGLAGEPEGVIPQSEGFNYRVQCARPANVPDWEWLCCDYATFVWRTDEPVNVECGYVAELIALPVRCVKDRAE